MNHTNIIVVYNTSDFDQNYEHTNYNGGEELNFYNKKKKIGAHNLQCYISLWLLASE